MPSTRPIKLDKWGISWEEYKELVYFCLQYNQKKKAADALLTIPSTTPSPAVYHEGGREYGTFLPHGTKISDPVAATAERREKLLNDVRMIEAAAKQACDGYGEELYKALLKAVTTKNGTRKIITHMNITISERKLYEVRRKFFYILSVLRNG